MSRPQPCLNSSLQNFFESYLPQLETAARNTENETRGQEPAFFLDELALMEPVPRSRPTQSRPPSNQETPKKQQIASGPSLPKDCSLEELVYLVQEFQKNSAYCQKLANIMISGLKESLGDDIFQIWALGKLRPTFIPLVCINADNTPYVEFIIKSDSSDQAPSNQLINYTEEHMAYSQYILDTLHGFTKRQLHIESSQARPRAVMANTSTTTTSNTTLARKLQPDQYIQPPHKRPVQSQQAITSRQSLPSRPLQKQQQPATQKQSQLQQQQQRQAPPKQAPSKQTQPKLVPQKQAQQRRVPQRQALPNTVVYTSDDTIAVTTVPTIPKIPPLQKVYSNESSLDVSNLDNSNLNDSRRVTLSRACKCNVSYRSG